LRYDRKLSFAATRDRASALQRLDAKSDAVQNELSELFPSKDSPRIDRCRLGCPPFRLFDDWLVNANVLKFLGSGLSSMSPM
jgi:hypothetical protein